MINVLEMISRVSGATGMAVSPYLLPRQIPPKVVSQALRDSRQQATVLEVEPPDCDDPDTHCVYLPIVANRAVTEIEKRPVETIVHQDMNTFIAYAESLFTKRGLDPKTDSERVLQDSLTEKANELTPRMAIIISRQAYTLVDAQAQSYGFSSAEEYLKYQQLAIAHVASKYGYIKDFQPWLNQIHIIEDGFEEFIMHPLPSDDDPSFQSPYNVRSYKSGDQFFPHLIGTSTINYVDNYLKPGNIINVKIPDPNDPDNTIVVPVEADLMYRFFRVHGISYQEIPGLGACIGEKSSGVISLDGSIITVDPFDAVISCLTAPDNISLLQNKPETTILLTPTSIGQSIARSTHLQADSSEGTQLSGNNALSINFNGETTVPEAVIGTDGYTITFTLDDDQPLPTNVSIGPNIVFVKTMDILTTDTTPISSQGGIVNISPDQIRDQQETGSFFHALVPIMTESEQIRLPLPHAVFTTITLSGSSHIKVQLNPDIVNIIEQNNGALDWIYSTRLASKETPVLSDTQVIVATIDYVDQNGNQCSADLIAREHHTRAVWRELESRLLGPPLANPTYEQIVTQAY